MSKAKAPKPAPKIIPNLPSKKFGKKSGGGRSNATEKKKDN
jgi:hypothetical protein